MALLVAVSCGRSTAEDGDETGGCNSAADCSKGEICEVGTCVPVPIDAGEAGAGQGGTEPSSGATPSESGAPAFFGGAGEASGGAGGEAGAPVSCEPAEKSCDGPSVRVCESDGHSMLILETCQRSQVCREGACRDIVCVPNAPFCEENAVRWCDEDGAGSKEVEPCVAGSYCSEQDGKASCGATKCQPGEALCNGGVTTTCAADGSGPQPGGTDCNTSNQVCVDGQCQGKLCTPGERVCQHDDVYVCSPNGGSLELFADCTANEACDVELASCRARLCEPGKLGCDSNRIVSCNDLGTGWVQSGTDCAKDDALCVEGSCKSVVCKAGAAFCKNGDVYTCDALGVKETLTSECAVGTQHCEAYGGGNYAYCASNACKPGTPVCDYGNLLTTCKDDGSGPSPGGTGCGTDKVCSEGACKAKACEPYTSFCKDGDVYHCYGDSLSYYRQADCVDDTRCVAGDSVKCEPFPCAAGKQACLANTAGTCAEDGLGLSQSAESCAADGKVCNASGGCVPSVEDVLGQAEDLTSQSAGYLVADLIDVSSDRKLSELQAQLALAAPRTLHWVILEAKGGSFAEKVLEVTTSAQAGSGAYSSGDLNFVLKAGKAYVIGVGAQEGGFAPYVDAAPFERRISFGRCRGSVIDQYSSSVYIGNVDTIRLFDLTFKTSLP
jgi:hypothetical protein